MQGFGCRGEVVNTSANITFGIYMFFALYRLIHYKATNLSIHYIMTRSLSISEAQHLAQSINALRNLRCLVSHHDKNNITEGLADLPTMDSSHTLVVV